MLVAAYCRYSSENQRDGYSIEAQSKAIKEYCAAAGHTIYKIYVDEALSATDDDRESFLSMIDDAKAGLFQCIVVHKLDRFARNRYDSAIYGKVLEELGITLYSILEPIASDDTPEALLFRGMVETMNEYYSRNLGRETIKGKDIAARSFKHLGGPVPFGYMLDENRVYTPDPQEAPIVLEVFKKYDSGVKIIEIARWLAAINARTRYNKPYTPEAISRMLTHTVYIGRYTWGARSKRKKFEPFVADHAFPAIVPEDLFMRVSSAVLAGKYGPRKRFKEVDYLLTGYLYCELCGAHLFGFKSITDYTNKAGEHVQYFAYRYRCSDYVRRKKAIRMDPSKPYKRCELGLFKKEELEAFVYASIKSVIFSDEGMEFIAKAMQDRIKAQAAKPAADVKKVEAQIKAVSTKMERLLDLYLEGGIDKQAYSVKNKELAEQVKLLEAELSRIKVPAVVADFKALKEVLAKYCGATAAYSGEELKVLLSTFVERIEVSNEHIVIYYKIELPGLPKKSAHNFVRKTTSVSHHLVCGNISNGVIDTGV